MTNLKAKRNTVKPELTTTSEQRPPAYNDHHFGVLFPLLYHKATSEQPVAIMATNLGAQRRLLYTSFQNNINFK